MREWTIERNMGKGGEKNREIERPERAYVTDC
jgi:hypothetical protein